ncbi:hypothetical protein U0070_002543 [Myodes glareolus]|uniref:Uncharacterized protein n=1 Tax=Myodes glareolus TaxID=447135 RepID=A0AAW0HP12_MYOGA
MYRVLMRAVDICICGLTFLIIKPKHYPQARGMDFDRCGVADIAVTGSVQWAGISELIFRVLVLTASQHPAQMGSAHSPLYVICWSQLKTLFGEGKEASGVVADVLGYQQQPPYLRGTQKLIRGMLLSQGSGRQDNWDYPTCRPGAGHRLSLPLSRHLARSFNVIAFNLLIQFRKVGSEHTRYSSATQAKTRALRKPESSTPARTTPKIHGHNALYSSGVWNSRSPTHTKERSTQRVQSFVALMELDSSSDETESSVVERAAEKVHEETPRSPKEGEIEEIFEVFTNRAISLGSYYKYALPV